MLILEGVETAYEGSPVLFGIDLEVGAGEAVGLLGRNGMGKTTTVRSIMGLTMPKAGTIVFGGERIERLPAHATAVRGIGLVPEGRQVFPNLTVEENLIATARNRFGRKNPWTLARVYALFPRLEERKRNLGSQLSGGEQQMLAIGRALLTNPKLLICDEATEGLAPLLRAEIWRSLRLLKDEGQELLVIDSNLRELLKVTDRNYLIEKGRIVWQGTSEELDAAPEVKARYLGV
jgi:branched-chain amino acid transport system ATP-binding protein